MSYQLNKKLRDLTPYSPISGEYKIRLDANESYFNASNELLEKIKSNISDLDFNRYPDPYATGVCKLFADFYGISDRNVTAGNGSDELINIIVGSFLEYGDKILTFDFDFSMYAFYGELLEHPVEVIEKDENLKIDIDKAISFTRENDIKMVMFSNPCNPTSVGMDKADVIKLIESVDALIILDEAYMDFYGQSLIKTVCEYDNVIMLKTASKAIGMASIRLGFAIANDTLTDALRAAKSPYNVNSVTQMIGEAVYSNPQLLIDNTKAIIDSKNYLYNEIVKLNTDVFEKIYNSDTNFVFIKTKYAVQIYKKLLEKSIAIRFMKGSYLRITAGSAQENKELISALKDIIGGLS